MDLKETILDLVRTAIKDLDEADLDIVGVVHKCIRIARMTKDWENLLWLRMTLREVEDQVTRHEIWDEIRPHFRAEELLELNDKNGEILISLRRTDENLVAGFSLQDTIERIKTIQQAVSSSYISPSPEISTALINLKKIVFRTKDRLYDYLTKLEANLIAGTLESDHYINNKLFILESVEERAPEIIEQLTAADQDCHQTVNCPNTNSINSNILMKWNMTKKKSMT
jgi:hypothetical protein